MSTVRRSIGFTIVVLLSLALPIGLFVWSVDSFLTSAIEPFSVASLKNGEIWFTEFPTTEGLMSSSMGGSEVKCVNLATGVERSTGMRLEGDFLFDGIWMGDVLYVIGRLAVYQRVVAADKPGTGSLKYFASNPGPGRGLYSDTIFLYNGELTTAIEDDAGDRRLFHLREGQWISGRKLRLPPPNCVWYDNPVDGRKMFQPEHQQAYSPVDSSLSTETDDESTVEAAASAPAPSNTIVRPVTAIAPPPPMAFGSVVLPSAALTPVPLPPSAPVPIPLAVAANFGSILQIQQCGEHVHVFFATGGGFWAYRDGLEFDDDEAAASALAAENVTRDANGWEPIPVNPNGDYIYTMVCDRDGALLTSMTGALIRRSTNGTWSTVNSPMISETNPIPRLIIDQSEGTVYVVGDSGEVHRVDGNSIQPTSFKVPNSVREYFARWERLLLGLVSAWLLHYVLVALGTSLLTRSATAVTYEFGIQKVILASTLRRGLALSIDLVILAVILSASFWAHSRLLGLHRTNSYYNELISLESQLLNELDNWRTGNSSPLVSIIQDFVDVFASLVLDSQQEDFWSTSMTVVVTVLIDTGLVLWLLKVYDEGRYGLTPGKRLLGIRTVRTTLRQCGFARALARDVMFGFDLLGFVTPLPAAASIVFSSNRQRLGDRVADTIVVNAGSTAEASNCKVVTNN